MGAVGDDDVADYKVFSDFLLKEQFVFIYHLYELLFVIIMDLYLLRLAAATARRKFCVFKNSRRLDFLENKYSIEFMYGEIFG